jgi:hypothetical protein
MNRGIKDLSVAVVMIAVVSPVFIFSEQFMALTKAHPYPMGFLKFAVLATFGEALKGRLTTGSWRITRLPQRALVWGIFGLWITAIFPVVAGGVQALMTAGMWPGPGMDDGWLKTFVIAFSTSFWVNVLSGYAWVMMLTHEWFNYCIEKRGTPGLVAFARSLDLARWFSTVPKTILFFWVPAHTVTFCLPPEWRILFAAALSVALGALLTFKKTAPAK